MRHASCAASGLAELGVREGDAIALLLRNDFTFFEAAEAANLIGAYAVPVNWHFQAAEINFILRDSEAKLLIAHADLLAPIADQLPADLQVIQVATPVETLETYKLSSVAKDELPYPCWSEWLATLNPWQAKPAANRNNTIYTSGTTGKPKGVIRAPDTAESAARMLRFVDICFGFTPGDPIRTVVTGPMYHSAPNVFASMALRAGGFVALQERFDPEQLLQWIEQHKITHLHMVPTMFIRLLALTESVRQQYDLSSLVFVAHAAAPCSPVVKQAMIGWWGEIIHEYYGGTEVGGVTHCNSAEALERPGTVGRAIESAEVKILSPENKPLAVGEVGEIYMWHHGFADFTYKNRDSCRQEMEYKGLVSLGDLGYLDEDGYLFICDRLRDMVISGGVNIYPAEIEGVLQQMPGIKDCAVFGIPDAEFGEALCSHIELDQGITLGEQQVKTFLNEQVARYKVPKSIVFVESLPREDTGKIFKRKIRDAYWEKQQRAI